MTGPKLGWSLGGLGSLAWLAILSVVWMAQGNVAGGLTGLGVFALGVVYLAVLAPWRFPQTPMRTLYLGFVAVLFLGVAVAVWQYRQMLDARAGLPMISLVSLFIPVFTLGRRSWADLHRQADGDDQNSQGR